MRFAAYIVAALFVLTAVLIIAALVAGFSSGVVQIDGWEMTIHWSEQSSAGVVTWGDQGMHDFYVTAPIIAFGIAAAVPLAVLGIVAAILFGRSADRDVSKRVEPCE